MNLETKITIYKFTPQLFTLTQNHPSHYSIHPIHRDRIKVKGDSFIYRNKNWFSLY